MVKRVLRLDSGLIELLADGQQFIAHGTHPSGARYEWDWNGHTVDFPATYGRTIEIILAGSTKGISLPADFHNAASEIRHSRDTVGLDLVDPMLGKLSILGWGREGQAYIECPWKDQHTTDSGVTETTYFPAGTRGYEQGHFKCLHAHCAERTDEDFLDAYGIRAAEFDVIPEEPEKKVYNITLRGGNLPQEILLAEEALLALPVPYYQRGCELVRPVVETVNASYNRKTHIAQLFNIDVHYLMQDLCKAATWLKATARETHQSKCAPGNSREDAVQLRPLALPAYHGHHHCADAQAGRFAA